MSERRDFWILSGFVLSVSLLAASLTALLLTGYYGRAQMWILSEICQGIIENQPGAEQAVLTALKEYKQKEFALNRSVLQNSITGESVAREYITDEDTPKEYPRREHALEGYWSGQADLAEENILSAYGYTQRDFLRPAGKYVILCGMAGFLAGGTLFLLTLLLRHKKEIMRIEALTDYLEKVNTGNNGLLSLSGEDEFSKLQDEIYKTVTELYQTRDAALKARKNFADNVYNIAHQIKTPVTSISLSAQMMRRKPSPEHLEQIQKQLFRLTHLEESLLLLSRIDAGTLSYQRRYWIKTVTERRCPEGNFSCALCR